jgi:ribonucleoside-diphosphate reductase alpha chain
MEERITAYGSFACRFNNEVQSGFDLPWDALAERVKTHGMRNSNVLAIAPTATISNICGVSQSIEPTYQNLFVKSNLSGEFTVINPYLVRDLKERGLWDDVMLRDLKHYDGSVLSIDRIPPELKRRYATAFEYDQFWLITAAAVRQKWIDQSQSLNLYLAHATGERLDALYRFAWVNGLKTTYYLRTLGATHVEKSTAMSDHIVLKETATVCSLDNPDCESCQ